MGSAQGPAIALDFAAQEAMGGCAMRAFHLVLANTLVQSIVNLTVWFALIFWAFLETRSVFVTGVIGGIYLVLGASLAIWFGSLVDHHRKHRVMLASSAGSFVLYAAALAWLLAVPPAALTRQDSPLLWGFMAVTMVGVIIGNLRLIALPTLVTALIAPDARDKANGKVGMVNGMGFLLTSGISGFLVAWDGMRGTLVLALAGTGLAFVHLMTVTLDEPAPQIAEAGGPGRIDLAGTIAVIRGVPGLMALMDGYGLSLMSVEAWGLLWAAASSAFIVSGLIIARAGLGANPLRTLMLVNVTVWVVAALFSVQSSVLLLALGTTLWLLLSPFAEAAEATTLQQVVPLERQGRVFGFAQSVEQSAAPLTAFLIGPLTQFWAIPFMTDGQGADWIGAWYGTGPERGMALIFTLTGVLGIGLTLLAWSSRAYRMLCAALAESRAAEAVGQ
jgi:DHA3 family multidrug efflux protein-like MFS transporter